jgi:hypothetical protein
MENTSKQISDKQSAAVKTISELLDVLSQIDVSSGQSGTMICDDGTEMTLGFKIEDGVGITTISITKPTLNLTIIEEKTTEQLNREFRGDKTSNLQRNH